MHILILTHYFPPEVNAPAQRAWDHARAWRDAGHNVTVVTCAPNHPYGEIYPGYRNTWRSVETKDGVRVIRIWTLLSANSGVARRSLNYASFLISASLQARRLPAPDVVIATSPQFLCGLSGFSVSRTSDAPWILEVRDLWPESVVAVGAMRAGLATKFLARLETWAYGTCDHIVSVSPGFADRFRAANVPDEKVSLVPNGVDVEQFDRAAELDPSTRSALAPIAGRFIVSWIGTLGMAHQVDVVLDAAQQLREDRRIGFLLAGSGAERSRLSTRARELGLSNVVFLEQQPREQIPALFELSSAAVVHLRDDVVFQSVIPTKLIEAMAAAKPILLGVRGTAQAILESAKAGVAFQPGDAHALADRIRTLADSPQQGVAMGAAGREAVRRDWSRMAMAQRYLTVLDRVVAERREAA